MAVKKRARRSTVELTAEMQAHLQDLNCADIASYQQWCQDEGFRRTLNKNWKQRASERFHYRKDAAREKMSRGRREKRQPLAVIKAICERELLEAEVSQPQLKRLCQAVQANTKARRTRRFQHARLFEQLSFLYRSRARFFDDHQPISEFGDAVGNSYIEALTLLSSYSSHWIRPLETWEPRSKNPHRQFCSLLRHLFAKYEQVPEFFAAVWFTRKDDSARQRNWYLHVGRGYNLRQCDLPLQLTKKMAHAALRAPRHCTVEQALRYGQVIGLGGSPALAGAIIATRLGQQFEHDDFWSTVIAWFITHHQLELTHVGPIVDYLHHQRFVPFGPYAGGNQRLPAQPNLSMRGRTPGALLRQVEQWHRQLARQNQIQFKDWEPTDLPTFVFTEGSVEGRYLKTWTIRELLSTKSLIVEGRQLSHCVASYSSFCGSKNCSIWTLECATSSQTNKLLTIELNPLNRTIRQIRGKFNRMPTEKERKVIDRWVSAAGLIVPKYI